MLYYNTYMKIFTNAHIITMKSTDNFAQAMLVDDGYIKKIGTNEEILKLKTDDCEVIDLDNKTVMPSFTNLNSSLYYLAQSIIFCDLNNLSNPDLVKKVLENYIKQNKLNGKNEFVLGIGLSNELVNKKAINKQYLDEVSKKLPILISNVEGNSAICNSAMIELLKQKHKLKDFTFPENGFFDKDNFAKIINHIPAKTIDDIIKCLTVAQDILFSKGITTCQDNVYDAKELNVYVTSSTSSKLKMDVVVNLEANIFKDFFPTIKDKLSGYSKNFRIAGLCLDIDGNLAMKQALISKPYVENEKETNDHGLLAHKELTLYNILDWAISQKTQLCIKAYGDKALEMFLNYLTKADVEKLKIVKEKKFYIYNSLISQKSIEQLKLFKLGYSCFASQLWYLSDIYSMTLNNELLSKNYLPLKTIVDNGINLISYEDGLFSMPNIFEGIWSLVNRRARSLKYFDKNQSLNVFEALKTVTINPSIQLFEDSRKGTLSESKYADFIVLSENPLEIDQTSLSSIKVIATYKRGECVFKK